MRLKLTLTRPSGHTDDIVVTADASATVGDIATAIAQSDPRGPQAGADQAPPADLTIVRDGDGRVPVVVAPSTPLGEAPIASGVLAHLAPASSARESVADLPVIASLRVMTGADAGLERRLRAGSLVIGRDASSDIVLSDPLVSKQHARLVVGTGRLSTGVDVIDLGSANGVVVDGGIVDRVTLTDAERVVLGDTEIEIVPLQAAAETPAPAPAAAAAAMPAAAPISGPVPFNRSPRVEKRYLGREFAAPEVPTDKEAPDFPLLAMITPVLLGLSMFFITQRPASLLFVLFSPVMLIGNFLTEKKRNRRRLAKRVAAFSSGLDSLVTQLDAEKVTEREARLAESPSTRESYEAAMLRGPLLWTRRPEHWSFLNVRLGIGAMSSRNTIDVTKRTEILPEFQALLDETIRTNATLEGVPIVDNLYDAGALGIVGSPESAIGSIDSVLVQLTSQHSPSELVVASLVTARWSRQLEWLKWLPHTSSPHSPIDGSHLADSASSAAALLAGLEALVESRLRGASLRRGAIREDKAALVRGADVGTNDTVAGTRSDIPAVVVLISDDVSLDRARLVHLAERAADAGVFPIWMATDVAALPAVCRTYLEILSDGAARVGFVRLGERIDDVTTELVAPGEAERFARALAPVFDAGAVVDDDSDLPRSVSLVTLLGTELTADGGGAASAVVDRWRQNSSLHDRTPGAAFTPRKAGRLRATVGSAGLGPMHLDLRAQGPHALVGGTTGAGKSEFLQAWVLAMAAEYSPDRVTFLFVDYKGGSAFADCVALPHCVGLVTDLSPHLVRRALTSLRAELHFREHLLNRKKAKDLLELEKRGDPDSPPALVLVIDEFAALVGEVPEFVDGVVDIAQRGRSLGIHLIMATQRPAGVIKDNLRANTNLRVALRMADESDSQDVIGVKEAAHFDPSVPGRAIAKTGPGRLLAFQSAYAGGWTSSEPARPAIEIASLRFGGETVWEPRDVPAPPSDSDLGPTDQQRLVAAVVAASVDAAVPPPRRPWLDEMASVYDLGKLRQRTDAELLIGIADIPERQEQRPVYFRPDVDGHLAVYGTGGSGKSVALRTLVAAAAITPRGGPVRVYGIDFGAGSLRMLDGLPHVGSIIGGDDSERIVRLFRMLRAELDARGLRYADASASSVTDYRSLTGEQTEPRILLVIDGFPAFRAEWEVSAGRLASYDVFKDILSDGRQLGIHVVFTADRAGSVPSSVASSIQRRIVLRLSDEIGYSLLDAPADVLGPGSPPGRAVVDGVETQVAVLGGSSSVSAQSAALARLAESMRRVGTPEAPGVGSMPTEYSQRELPAEIGGRPVLGIGESTLGPVAFDPVGTLLVSGGPGSGRSSALESIANALVSAHPSTDLYYLGNARSSFASRRGLAGRATTVEEVAALAKELAARVVEPAAPGHAGIAIVLESIGDFLQTPADAAIVDLVKKVRRSDHFLVAEGETPTWSSSWPLMAELKNGRRGLLLQPDTMDGDIILKTPIPRAARSEYPVGRGVLVERGAAQRIQLPLPV